MPRLTPGYEPWRPLFESKLPDIEAELARDLGPIRARSLALELVDDDGVPVLVVRVDSGEKDRHATTLIVEVSLAPIVAALPGMRLDIEHVERPRLRVVE